MSEENADLLAENEESIVEETTSVPEEVKPQEEQTNEEPQEEIKEPTTAEELEKLRKEVAGLKNGLKKVARQKGKKNQQIADLEQRLEIKQKESDTEINKEDYKDDPHGYVQKILEQEKAKEAKSALEKQIDEQKNQLAQEEERERFEEIKDDLPSDFSQVVEGAASVSVGDQFYNSIAESPYKHHLLYHLASNKGLAAETLTMSKTEQMFLVGRLENEIRTGSLKLSNDKRAPSKPVDVTPTLSSQGATVEKKVGDMTDAEYEEYYNNKFYKR